MKTDPLIMGKWQKIKRDMDMVNIFQLIIVMKGIGTTIWLMAKVYIKVARMSIMMDNGKMVRSRGMVSVCIVMEVITKAIGRITTKMEVG